MTDKKTGSKIFSNMIFVTFAALLCCALWGSATPFIKIGSALMIPQKHVPSTMLFAGVRFTFAGILTILIYSIARRKFLYPKRENVGKVALIGYSVYILLHRTCTYIGR